MYYSKTFAALILCCLLLIIFQVETRPHDNTYTPIIRFLKDLRRARKHGGFSSVLPIKEGENKQDDSLVAAGSNSESDNIRVGINSGGGGNSNGNNNNNNYDAALRQFQLEQQLAQIAAQLPTQPPYPIEMVNSGLRTLLGGVNQGSLADILRGSFMFTRNQNVQSVANTVIDSIFGQRAPPA